MDDDKVILEERIRELQDSISNLRMSRRILMTLVEQTQKEKQEELTKLEAENSRLQKENSRYARYIWEKNNRIVGLESQIERDSLDN